MFKLSKKFIDCSIASSKAVQACLIFISLITMVYFILDLMKVKLPEQITSVFDIVYNFQSNIYKPELSMVPVDFTFVTFAIEMLLIAGLLVYFQSFLVEFNNHLNKVIKYSDKRYEEKFNDDLSKTTENIENKNNNFAILFNVKITKLTKNIYTQKNEVDFDVATQKILIKLRDALIKNFGVYTEKISSGYLAFFDDVKQCDKVFDLLFAFQEKIKPELAVHKLNFNVVTAVCIAGKQEAKDTYVFKLEKLLSLSIPNKIMALNEFKNRYDLLKNKTYEFISFGTYTLNDNLIEVLAINKKDEV